MYRSDSAYGITEANWRDAIDRPQARASAGRFDAVLSGGRCGAGADRTFTRSQVACSGSTRSYAFTDIDGARPHWDATAKSTPQFRRQIDDPHDGGWWRPSAPDAASLAARTHAFIAKIPR
jgi:hypothetical protein